MGVRNKQLNIMVEERRKDAVRSLERHVREKTRNRDEGNQFCGMDGIGD